MKVSLRAIAIAAGVLWGGAILFLGLINLASPSFGLSFLQVISSVYPGFHASRTIGDRKEATALGADRLMASMALAALANGASGHAMDFDDTQLSTTPDRTYGLLTHPTVPPLAAALAISERSGLSGAAFLEAFLVGFEVECKIAEAIDPSHYVRGFHSSGTAGTFASRCGRRETAAAERPADRAHAGDRVQSGERHPRELRHDDQAAPCRAARPRTASSPRNWPRGGSPVETMASTDPGDSFRCSAAAVDLERMVPVLGKPYTIVSPGVSIKPYPCGSLSHPSLDAMLKLVLDDDLKPEQVRAVRLACRLEHPRAAPDHSQSHVESTEHLVARHAAELLQVLENRRHRPGIDLNHGRNTSGKHTRKIFGDAAARDMSHRRYAFAIRQQTLHRRPVAFVCLHQLVADFAFEFVDVGLGRVMANFKQQLAGERVAVGVQAIRGQTQNHIANLDLLSRDDAFALNHADDESSQIVFAFGIEARHLRRFAANQGTAVVLAGFRQTFNHLLRDFRFELAGREIIHEEERSRALHRDVIHTVVHQIRADGVMHLHLECDFQLGANPVHAGDQNRIEILGLVNREQAPEPADLAEYPPSEGFVSKILDPLLGAVGAVDIDPGVGIRNRRAVQGILGHGCWLRL